MAKKQIFDRKSDTLTSYLTELEDLLKKNRGTGLYEGYDVNPRAFRVGGQVVDPSGLGQDVMRDDLKFAPYDASSIPMAAPQTQTDPAQFQFDLSGLDQTQIPAPSGQIDFTSMSGLQQVIDEVSSIPISRTEDGGLLYSNGTVRYEDGSSRQATRQDVPQVVRQFSNGSVLLTNGFVIDPNATVGRAYSGLSGLSDLIFGRQQTVTQPYGNVNPIEPTPGNVNLGTDFRTRDLQNRNLTFPFPVEVVGMTFDDGTRFGDQSGHQGYGNSVYLKLPNGAVIHLSHLSDMENFQVGSRVEPFDYIGTPGQTGNTYGEHLDVEYYDQEGKIADPQSFWLDSVNYVDQNKIAQSLEAGKETLPPEERQWVEAQQATIAAGRPMSLNPEMINQPQDVVQPQQPSQAPLVAQAGADLIDRANLTGQYGVGVSELLRGDVPGARQEIARTVEAIKPQTELGVTEGVFTPEAQQARISALSQQPDKTNPYLQLAGNVLERVGDTLGIPEGALSEAVAGGATKRTGQALASEIGSQPEQVPGIRQNLKDIGVDLAKRGQGVITQAGQGIEELKSKASNLFQKPSLVGLFQGQKQVGEAKGSSIIQTGANQSRTPDPDAFFKYGGADQYAQYLIDNARDVKGGALDTSLFKPEFYQDPNRVANVFGETAQGEGATKLYKDYLGSLIKPGFNEPYRTERVQEGDTIYEYKIPVPEYFQNQYYQNLISETPQTLKSGFSFDQFQLPTTTKSASEFKGEVPTKSKETPIFKSGVVDLFKRAGSKAAQLAGDVFKTPAAVYQPSQPSQTFSIPESVSNLFKTPTAPVSLPEATKTAIQRISQPSLQDYLAMGKTPAQYYAETGQQSVLDRAGGNVANIQQAQQQGQQTGTGVQSLVNQSGRTVTAPAGTTLRVDAGGQAQAVPSKTATLPGGRQIDFGTPVKTVSAQVAPVPAASGNWLQTLFKKMF